VASSFAVGSSRLGAAVRAAAAQAGVPGFFALAAEAPTLRATCHQPGGDREVASSLRPSAGGANEEAMPRARDVTPRCGLAVSKTAEPGRGAWISLSGGRVLALTSTETPRAFHGFNQPPGDRQPRLDQGTNDSKDATTEGPRRPFGLREPLHPFAKRMTVGPVRALRLPVARRCAPREASRLSLDAPA
jgi:hypothetical protein